MICLRDFPVTQCQLLSEMQRNDTRNIISFYSEEPVAELANMNWQTNHIGCKSCQLQKKILAFKSAAFLSFSFFFSGEIPNYSLINHIAAW